MAQTPNTVWYCNYGNGSSTGYYAVTAWAASTSTSAGALRRQLAAPSVGNERVFVAIVAGTTGGSAPTWVVTKGAKTTDGTVTWQECTGQSSVNGDVTSTPLSSANRSSAITLGLIIKNNAGTYYFICSTAGTTGSGEPTYVTTAGSTTTDSGCTWTCIGAVGNFSAWGAPFARIANTAASNWGNSNGNTIYVSSIHAETQAGNITISAGSSAGGYVGIYCVANSGNIPPQSGDLTTGATVTGTGFSQFALTGYLDVAGVAFSAGSGANQGTITINGGLLRLRNCPFTIPGTATGSSVRLGGQTAKVLLENVTFACGPAMVGVYCSGGLTWRWTPSALSLNSGSWATVLFNQTTTTSVYWPAGVTLFEGIDLSAFGGSNLVNNTTVGGTYVFLNCKIPSAVAAYGAAASPFQVTVDLINCDSGGATYRHERWWYEGSHVTETTAVHTGGASDGTTTLSWKIVIPSTTVWLDPFECMPIDIWNAVTATNVTVTLEAAYLGAALPNNDDIWLDVAYLGTASSTLASRVSGTKANFLSTPTAQTASTASWDGAATARANSTAYTVGNFVALGSNTGRLFICTTAGTSAGSEPGGYASAVDGGSVTDGSAVFQALVRFTLSAVLTSPQPQSAGYLHAYVRAAKASATFWVDPKITLS